MAVWRWLLRVAGFVSLVLLAGALWLWVRSWSVHDVLMRHRYWVNPGRPNEILVGEHYLWLNNSQGKATISTMLNTTPRTGTVDPVNQKRFGGKGSLRWDLVRNPLNDLGASRLRYSK